MSKRKKQGWKRSNAPWYGRNASARARSVEESFEELRKRQGANLFAAVTQRMQDNAAIRQAVFGTPNPCRPADSLFVQNARPSAFEQLLESELIGYEKLFDDTDGPIQGCVEGDDGGGAS